MHRQCGLGRARAPLAPLILLLRNTNESVMPSRRTVVLSTIGALLFILNLAGLLWAPPPGSYIALVRVPPPATLNDLPELASAVRTGVGKGEVGPFQLTFQDRTWHGAPLGYYGFCAQHRSFSQQFCWDGRLSGSQELSVLGWKHDLESDTHVLLFGNQPQLSVRVSTLPYPSLTIFAKIGLLLLALGGLLPLLGKTLGPLLHFGLWLTSGGAGVISLLGAITPAATSPSPVATVSSFRSEPRPQRGGPPAPILQFAKGERHSCVLLADGRVRCWGRGWEGQLGYGTNADVDDPRLAGDVPLGGMATQISVGSTHSCALLKSGTVRCWGDGSHGQLGLGRVPAGWPTPEELGDVPVGAPAVSLASGYKNTCALLTEGRVRCWGSRALGYGRGAMTLGDKEPAGAWGDVPLGGRATRIAAEGRKVCAVMETGAVRCWGDATKALMGYPNHPGGDIGEKDIPKELGDVALGGPALQVSLGYEHSCALLRSGTVECWGSSSDARLCSTPPSEATIVPPTSIPGLSKFPPVREVLAGYTSTCFFFKNGDLRCCGTSDGGTISYKPLTLVSSAVTSATTGGEVCWLTGTDWVQCHARRIRPFR